MGMQVYFILALKIFWKRRKNMPTFNQLVRKEDRFLMLSQQLRHFRKVIMPRRRQLLIRAHLRSVVSAQQLELQHLKSLTQL